MDLLYFESPPGLQFLHCIQNTTKGGSSIFADSFRAATLLRLNSPPLFRSLTKFPVTYHYQNDGYHYHFTRPTVVLDEHSYLEMQRISQVNWAPPFQAPFEVDIGSNGNGQFRQYIVAAKEFAKNVDDLDSQFELRLEEGVCSVFFNRRILHSRRAFDTSTGDRWLKGAYVDIDAFQSKYRTLSKQLRSEKEREDDAYSYIR
jgi:gamma-butyrobetaine dioxygenase